MITEKLLSRPLPHDGEGLRAYLVRLADTNGVSSKELSVPDRELRGYMRTWLALNEDNEAAYLNQFSSQMMPLGSSNSRMWNAHSARFCPICLEESGAWKKEWELYFVTACSKHKIRLIDHCSNCGEMQRTIRHSLNSCNCGAEYAQEKTLEASEREIQLAHEFSARLGAQPSNAPHLQLLDFDQLYKVLDMLSHNSKSSTLGILTKLAHVSNAKEYISVGANALLDWPNGFHAYMRSKGEANNKEFKNSLTINYGPFYSTLYKEFNEPCYAFLQCAFEDYVHKNWRGPLAGRNKRISKETRDAHPWKPMAAVAKKLHRSRRQIEHLAASYNIDIHQTKLPSGRTSICINSQDVDALERCLNDHLDLRDATELLGLKKTRVIQLLHEPTLHLVSIHKKSKTEAWKISKRGLLQILNLVANLPVQCLPENCGLSDGAVRLSYVLRFWLRDPNFFAELILAVKKGEISPIAVAKQSAKIGDWIFNADSLQEWLRIKRQETMRGTLKISDAAKSLQINTAAFYHLVRSGYCRTLMSERCRNPLISLDALDEFRERFIWGENLSDRLRLGSRCIYTRLKQFDVLPVSGPQVDGGVLNVYMRTTAFEHAAFQIRCESDGSEIPGIERP